MEYDEAFRKSIPTFLRRPEEAWPEKPMFMSRDEPEPPTGPAATHAAPARVRRTGTLPWLARRRAGHSDEPPGRPADGHAEARVSEAAGPAPAVDPAPATDEDAAPPAASNVVPGFFRETRHHFARAVAAISGNAGAEEDDVAFQVTLPRSVIRQIRLLAATEGTTHRAIVLRSLRQAGLVVPKGADVDRRRATVRRRGPGEAVRA